jgi:hypothetical protein
MWTWDSAAPGCSAAGACHDEERALRAVETWMREHQARAGRVAPVGLDVVELAYVPAGRPLEAIRHRDDRITWRPAAA